MKLFSQYWGVFRYFSKYWSLYGGTKALLTSPYFHLSIVLAVISIPLGFSGDWANLSLQIIPNILGFSLGGYAILLAFSNEKFLSIISSRNGHSPFISVSSAFLHFIIIQLLSILLSISYNASPIENLPATYKLWIINHLPYSQDIYRALAKVVNFTGLTVFFYSLTTALAATMAIFRLSIWYDRHLSNTRDNKENLEE